MTRRGRWLVLPLLSTLFLLTAMAYASPPDPSWISGFYDDADYDDVVILVTSAVGTVESWSPLDVRPSWLCVFQTFAAEPQAPPAPGLRAPATRAPPLAQS
jgi:hypothetical protein